MHVFNNIFSPYTCIFFRLLQPGMASKSVDREILTTLAIILAVFILLCFDVSLSTTVNPFFQSHYLAKYH
jgi:hypothetical protein